MTSDYELLKAYGHSPAKAAEIILDAKRGDFFSRKWIAFVASKTQSGSTQSDGRGL